jgi:malic enzyme
MVEQASPGAHDAPVHSDAPSEPLLRPRRRGSDKFGHLSHEALDHLQRGAGPVPVSIRGEALLSHQLLNKDAAFPENERATFDLNGLLPPRVMSMDEQVELELERVRRKDDDLERYIGLAALQDRNETLFYKVLGEHLEEFMPVVYTPTVGRACQQYSHIMRRPRGIWITPDDLNRMPELLARAARGELRLVVATDNERILGLGDQGAGGIAIPIGKLALYSAAAGIHPGYTLPVSLDVGTDRPELLDDPLYFGWHRPRLRGARYDAFIEAFVKALRDVAPRAVLQWEDFKQHNALRILDQYRGQIASFNDDVEGTAAVALAGVLAALRHLDEPLSRQRVVLLGAGAAGIGIARLLRAAMREGGMDRGEIERAVLLLDSRGLVHEGRTDVDDDKRPFSAPIDACRDIGFGEALEAPVDLGAVVDTFRPTVLIGTTGVPGAFTESAVRAMAAGCGRPIVLPLSNPTSLAEARPIDILSWTEGRALVASGSPFPAVETAWGRREIGQANNVYIFPGIGLGAIVSEARELDERTFLRAAQRLAELVSPERLAVGALYPPVSQLRTVARSVAAEVVRQGRDTGVGRQIPDELVDAEVAAAMWTPDYLPFEPA